MNSRQKRFILKREEVRELKKSRAGISRVPRYFITSRAIQAPLPLSPERKTTLSAHRVSTSQPKSLSLSLAWALTPTALHLEKPHDYYHTTSATSPLSSSPTEALQGAASPSQSSPHLRHLRHFPLPRKFSVHTQTDRHTDTRTKLFSPRKPTYLPRTLNHSALPLCLLFGRVQASDPRNPTKKE